MISQSVWDFDLSIVIVVAWSNLISYRFIRRSLDVLGALYGPKTMEFIREEIKLVHLLKLMRNDVEATKRTNRIAAVLQQWIRAGDSDAEALRIDLLRDLD